MNVKIMKVSTMVWLRYHIAALFFFSMVPAAFPVSAHAQQQELSKAETAGSVSAADKKYFMESIDAYQKKDYDTAIRKSHELLHGYPDSPLRALTLYWLSQAYYRAGSFQEAALYLTVLSKEHPDFNLKGLLNTEQQELLAKGASGVLPQPNPKTDTGQPGSKPVPALSRATDAGGPEKEQAAPLQTLDEMLKEHPDTPFHDLILFRVAQLYYSAGNLPEAAEYLKRLSAESPAFPLNSLLSREQRALLTRQDPAVAAPVATVTPPAPSAPASARTSINPAAVKSASVVSLRDVIVGEAGVEIMVDGRMKGYKSFRQSQPERLVVDILGAKNKMTVKSVAVNRHGIEKARIGSHPTSVRIVLDAAGSTFPPYEVFLSGKGLLIIFKAGDLTK